MIPSISSNSSLNGTDSANLKYFSVPWTFVEPTAMPHRKVRSTLSYDNVVYQQTQQQENENEELLMANIRRRNQLFDNSDVIFDEEEAAIIRRAQGDTFYNGNNMNNNSNSNGNIRNNSSATLLFLSDKKNNNLSYLNQSRLDLAKEQHRISASNSRMQLLEEENMRSMQAIQEKEQNKSKYQEFLQNEEMLSCRSHYKDTSGNSNESNSNNGANNDDLLTFIENNGNDNNNRSKHTSRNFFSSNMKNQNDIYNPDEGFDRLTTDQMKDEIKEVCRTRELSHPLSMSACTSKYGNFADSNSCQVVSNLNVDKNPTIKMTAYRIDMTGNNPLAADVISKPRRRLLKIIEPMSIIQKNPPTQSKVSPQLKEMVNKSFTTKRFTRFLTKTTSYSLANVFPD